MYLKEEEGVAMGGGGGVGGAVGRRIARER